MMAIYSQVTVINTARRYSGKLCRCDSHNFHIDRRYSAVCEHGCEVLETFNHTKLKLGVKISVSTADSSRTRTTHHCIPDSRPPEKNTRSDSDKSHACHQLARLCTWSLMAQLFPRTLSPVKLIGIVGCGSSKILASL